MLVFAGVRVPFDDLLEHGSRLGFFARLFFRVAGDEIVHLFVPLILIEAVLGDGRDGGFAGFDVEC